MDLEPNQGEKKTSCFRKPFSALVTNNENSKLGYIILPIETWLEFINDNLKLITNYKYIERFIVKKFYETILILHNAIEMTQNHKDNSTRVVYA